MRWLCGDRLWKGTVLGKLVEEIEHRPGEKCGITRHVSEALGDQQPQPPGIGGKPIRRQNEEDGGVVALEIGEAEVRSAKHGRHARTVEKVGVAQRGRKNAGRFHVLHSSEQAQEALRGKREIFAQRCEVSAPWRFRDDDLEDEAGDQCLCFFIPMCVTRHAGFIEHHGVGQRAGILRDIRTSGIEHIKSFESSGPYTRHAKWIEDVNRAKLLTGATSDSGIF